jgi:hypothetical protein
MMLNRTELRLRPSGMMRSCLKDKVSSHNEGIATRRRRHHVTLGGLAGAPSEFPTAKVVPQRDAL